MSRILSYHFSRMVFFRLLLANMIQILHTPTVKHNTIVARFCVSSSCVERYQNDDYSLPTLNWRSVNCFCCPPSSPYSCCFEILSSKYAGNIGNMCVRFWFVEIFFSKNVNHYLRFFRYFISILEYFSLVQKKNRIDPNYISHFLVESGEYNFRQICRSRMRIIEKNVQN